MQSIQIKESILDACSEADCPVWLVGEVGQLLNSFENEIRSEIKKESGRDIGRMIEAMKQSYPMSKAEYVDYDVFLGEVMKKYAEMQTN